MKKYSLGLLFVAIVTLSSCTKDNSLEEQMELEENTPVMIEKALLAIADPPMPISCSITALIAGQDITAGYVQITADDQNIYVMYKSDMGWYIDRTHLYIGDCDLVPTNRRGNPKIGHFPYKANHSSGTNEVTYTISKADLGASFCMLAHAVVSQVDSNGDVAQCETAWGDGNSFGGTNWAMFQELDMIGCVLKPDEPILRR